jgi:hypothetical protein
MPLPRLVIGKRGVTLYEALTEKSVRGPVTEVLRRKRECDPPSPLDLCRTAS